MPSRRPRSSRPPLADGLEAVIELAGGLKGELVDFGLSGRFEEEWEAFADEVGLDGSPVSTAVLDAFLLQHRMERGGTILARFVAERRPPLQRDDRLMLQAWGDVVQGVFEVTGRGAGLTVRNLVDDLDYEVHSNMGPAAFDRVPPGVFLDARIVPLGHGTTAWIMSGDATLLPAKDRATAARAALERLTAVPDSIARNPRLLQRAWGVQGKYRRTFIDEAGSDVVALPPTEASALLTRYYARMQQDAAKRSASGFRRADPADLGRLPGDLLDVETVGIVFDEQDGISLLPDLGAVEAFLEHPSAGGPGGAMLLDYLHSDSVPRSTIHLLVGRHPGTADEALRLVLDRPALTWSRDGERTLDRLKPGQPWRRRVPGISVIGERLTELLND